MGDKFHNRSYAASVCKKSLAGQKAS